MRDALRADRSPKRSSPELRSFALHYNPREQGWAEPQLVSRRTEPDEFLDVRFDDPWVRTADMNGEGRAAIVAIRPGRIEYWPSLGHGRYGRRIILRPAGEERFTRWHKPDHVVLADLNVERLADVISMGPGDVECWIDQSGPVSARRSRCRWCRWRHLRRYAQRT